MRTRQFLLDQIDALITQEKGEIFTAPSKWLSTNTSLLEKKIKGLQALREAISASKGDNKEIPIEWLKKTIQTVVEKHPALIEGFMSGTKKLLQNIAPDWESFSPASVATSSSALYSKPEYDYLFKIKLLGDSGVGKSSTLLRFCEGTFPENFISTIGCDFKMRQIDNIKFQLWDTAGQERFRQSGYERGEDAFIVMFDVTKAESFSNVQKWLQEIDRIGGGKSLIFLVGNKIDLEDRRPVSTEDAKEFADQLN